MTDTLLTPDENVARALEHAALLNRVLRLVLTERPVTEFLRDALDELLAVSWLAILPKGGVFLVEPESRVLELAAERNLGPHVTSVCSKVDFGHCLCGRAAEQQATQHASCIDARHETRFDGMSPHGHYNVPILSEGEVLGVLVVYLPHGHAREDTEIELLESFAEILGLVIRANNRKEQIRATQAELDGALRDSEGLMQTIWTHTIFSEAAPDGTITNVNDAFCDISGYTRDELIGAPHSIVNSGVHSRSFWREFWITLRSGKAWRDQVCNRRKDGSIYWVDSIVMPFIGADGKVERFVSIRIDITERKRAEETLARMGRILDDSSNEIYVFSAETLQFTLLNRGARENLGYSSSEVLELTPLDIKPEHDADSFAAMIRPLLDGAQAMAVFETVHQRKDGSVYPVMINLHYAAEETPPVFVAIVQDITERKAKDAEIERLAFYDPLTGLANRALLVDRLHKAVAGAERDGHSVSLLFLDLDRFKEINDTRGHAVGDAVLQEITRRFGTVVRGSDTLARIGGDEFVLLLERGKHPQTLSVIQRLQETLTTPIEIEGRSHSLGVSIGVATYPGNSRSPEELLQAADIAMYEAKASGCGHRFYDQAMGDHLARRLDLTERLVAAIAADRLEMHFQPIVSLEDGNLTGAEALLRWYEPDLGWISPGEFIPLAEERRMMGDLGAYVIDRSCAQIAAWRAAGLTPPPRLAINISAQQIELGPLLDVVRMTLDRYDLPGTALEFELTESSMMNDPVRSGGTLRALKGMGIHISIDDFGTGYSSLAHLKELEIDNLKIDMSFVRDLLTDSNSMAIVSATIAMAKGLGASTVAEGVEDAEQAEALRALDCDFAQGYHFDRALPGNAFALKWLMPAGLRLAPAAVALRSAH